MSDQAPETPPTPPLPEPAPVGYTVVAIRPSINGGRHLDETHFDTLPDAEAAAALVKEDGLAVMIEIFDQTGTSVAVVLAPPEPPAPPSA